MHRIDPGVDRAAGGVVALISEGYRVSAVATGRTRAGEGQRPAVLEIARGARRGNADGEVLRRGHADIEFGNIVRVGALPDLEPLLGGADGRLVVEGFGSFGALDRVEEARDAEGGQHADDDD